VRRSYQGDVTFRSRLNANSHDYRSVEYTSEVAAGGRGDLRHEVITRSGYNAKQQRVEVVGG
ncbi:MAG: hypothetical protein GY753_01700, partial [Gammaproteobacteria bacterium]|nr:hypothetical protein [Gammaproteobacteria bacterium]